MIKGKKILLIPVYSMRSYETGKYNLMADGNMARVISRLASSDFESAMVLIPDADRVTGIEDLKRLVNRVMPQKDIAFVYCPAYGSNAGETRGEVKEFMRFFFENRMVLPDYDMLLIEPNSLTHYLINQDIISRLTSVFWCPVSETTGFTPDFIKPYGELDKLIAENIPVAAATQSQVDFLGGMSFVDEDKFYEPKYFDYKTIFFPFRLSDPCYHAEEFKKAVMNLKDKYNFKVLYTDPNESGLFDDRDIFVKVPTTKEIYLQILKSKPIIPYLENTDDVLHISLHEFIYYGCPLIMLSSKEHFVVDSIEIGDVNQLETALEEFLK